MKVYIVFEGWPYEGDEVLGVFKTEGLAELYLSGYKKYNSCYYNVVEYTIIEEDKLNGERD